MAALCAGPGARSIGSGVPADARPADRPHQVDEGVRGERVVRSRLAQRIWTPRRFVELLDLQDAFDVRSLHWRDHDPDRSLEAIPRGGGPILAVLLRR